MPPPGHIPVMAPAVAELLLPDATAATDDGHASPPPARAAAGRCGPRTVLDCTIGRGGHAAALMPRMAHPARYIGLDVDPANVAFARERLTPIAAAAGVALTLRHADFRDAATVLGDMGVSGVHALLADLGFASTQMEDPDRGLSFNAEGPLDMRLDPTSRAASAATAGELINTLPQRDLADLIYRYGEERLSRKIARKIVDRRRQSPIESTSELADLVRRAYGPRGRAQRIHPATRTFQALRIAVNGELDALEQLLADLPRLLAEGGRAAVISFHSLEDRRVKHALLNLEREGLGRRLTRKPRTPDQAEQQANPRSRSAKLRAFERAT